MLIKINTCRIKEYYKKKEKMILAILSVVLIGYILYECSREEETLTISEALSQPMQADLNFLN